MNSERGNREWLDEYMSLKQVNPNNPFTVPYGYFDEVERQIVSFINVNELKNGTLSEGLTVPDNYFDELSDHIRSRIAIEETLEKDNSGFKVPEGYFDELNQQIQSRIVVEEALNESAGSFTVPEGYFEELSQQIQSRIVIEETLNEPGESFAVPEGYFDKLTGNILNKTVNQQPAKEEVIKRKGVIRRLFAAPAFKYATAACLTLAVGATIFLSKNSSNVVQTHDSSFLHKSLSQIPVDDIKDYLQQNIDPTDTRTLIDESKQVNADNLSNDLQDELDTSQ